MCARSVVIVGMNSHTDIIDLWPTLREYASDIGVPYGTAQVMRYRRSIHARHWDDVVMAARKRGLEGVTHEVLAHVKAKGRRSKHRLDARVSA
jgi:hypothetical protein